MDRLTTEKRSWNMSRIRGKNTAPEIKLRKYLYGRGVRYRLNSKMPGKPDLLIAQRIAIFVNGCFWHCHQGCSNFRIPKTRTEFWTEKLNGNVARDWTNHRKLEEIGVKVLVIWECQLEGAHSEQNMERIYDELRAYLSV